MCFNIKTSFVHGSCVFKKGFCPGLLCFFFWGRDPGADGRWSTVPLKPYLRLTPYSMNSLFSGFLSVCTVFPIPIAYLNSNGNAENRRSTVTAVFLIPIAYLNSNGNAENQTDKDSKVKHRNGSSSKPKGHVSNCS